MYKHYLDLKSVSEDPSVQHAIDRLADRILKNVEPARTPFEAKRNLDMAQYIAYLEFTSNATPDLGSKEDVVCKFNAQRQTLKLMTDARFKNE